MGFVFLGLLVWVPFIVAPLVIAIRALWLALTRPPNYRGEPVCERCRYRVAGLSVFTCPECGTDLRRTGIITPAMEMRRRGSTVGAIAGWTFVMFTGGLVLGSAVASMAVARMAPAMAAGMSTTVTTPLTSSTALYKSVSIVNEMGAAAVAAKPSIKIVLTDNAGVDWTMTLDPNSQTSTIEDSSKVIVYSGSMADEADIKALFDAAKVDTTNPKIQTEIKELSKVTSAVVLTPYANVASMTFKSLTPGTPAYASGAVSTPPSLGMAQDNTELIVMTSFGLLLFVLWIGGIAYIVVRRKRLTKELVLMESPRKESGSDSSGPPPMVPASI